MLTLLDCKQSSIPEIASVPANSREFARLINDACRRFMRRGEWQGTVVPIYTCVRNGCIVWNRYVGQIRKLNFCRTTIPVKNMWGDFLPYDRSGWDRSYWWSYLGQRCQISMQGTSPTYAAIPNGWTTVRAYLESPLDKNKTMTLFGEDSSGQTIRTKGNGPWVDGQQKSLDVPYIEWTSIRRIDRVLKDATNGPVRVYATDGTNMIDLAMYEPSETSPDYLRTDLHTNSTCTSGQPVIALVKLKFIPVAHDSDLVIVQNVDALEMMIQAIRSERAGDDESASKFEMKAIREGNLQLYDEDNENDAIPVNIDGMNRTALGEQRCF